MSLDDPGREWRCRLNFQIIAIAYPQILTIETRPVCRIQFPTILGASLSWHGEGGASNPIPFSRKRSGEVLHLQIQIQIRSRGSNETHLIFYRGFARRRGSGEMLAMYDVPRRRRRRHSHPPHAICRRLLGTVYSRCQRQPLLVAQCIGIVTTQRRRETRITGRSRNPR